MSDKKTHPSEEKKQDSPCHGTPHPASGHCSPQGSPPYGAPHAPSGQCHPEDSPCPGMAHSASGYCTPQGSPCYGAPHSPPGDHHSACENAPPQRHSTPGHPYMQGCYTRAGYPPPAYALNAKAPLAPDDSQSGWINFSDRNYLKGFLVATGLVLVASNPTIQKAACKGAVKLWSFLQGGFEEMKEQVQDAKAEMSEKD